MVKGPKLFGLIGSTVGYSGPNPSASLSRFWLFDGDFKDHDVAQIPAYGCFDIWSGDALY